jgi:hypothetical protein
MDYQLQKDKVKMHYFQVPIWVGTEQLRPGDLIVVDLGRMLGEKSVEYAGVYADPFSQTKGILGRIDGKVMPLGSASIYRRRADMGISEPFETY